MKQDVALTAVGMPALVLGEIRYPLLFSISAIKEWAEFKGLSFKEAAKGWSSTDLDADDVRCLLGAALRAGERRRLMFDCSDPHEVSEALLDHLLDLLHPDEAIALLVVAWSEPPREPDPPAAPESLPVGGEVLRIAHFAGYRLPDLAWLTLAELDDILAAEDSGRPERRTSRTFVPDLDYALTL